MFDKDTAQTAAFYGLAFLDVLVGISAFMIGDNHPKLKQFLGVIFIIILIPVGYLAVFSLFPESPGQTDSTPQSLTITLFAEDFEDDSAQRFRSLDGGNAQIVIDETGNKVYEMDNRSGNGFYRKVFGSNDWKNYQLEFRLRILNFGEEGSAFSYFGSDDLLVNYDFQFDPKWGKIRLGFWDGNSWSELSSRFYNHLGNEWYKVSITFLNGAIKSSVNNELVFDIDDNKHTKGAVALGVGPEARIQFDDVTVTSLDK